MVIGDQRVRMLRRKRSRRRLGRWALVASVVASLAPASVAWAHRQGMGQAVRADGISIPNLSHGQMAVIADNKAATLDLAARQTPTDPAMRRLENFINLQVFACW